MLRFFRSPSSHKRSGYPVVGTVGIFDGLHAGHQTLIRRMLERKTSLGTQTETLMLSFYPHPDVVLGKTTALNHLTSLRQKLRLLTLYGIDSLCALHFTRELSQIRAKEFVEKYLIDLFGVTHIVLGPDAHVGYKREGTPEFIAKTFFDHGLSAEILSFLAVDGTRVSSQEIRALLKAGEVERANVLLGRNFCFDSRVVHGAQRGRTLGFPTANLRANEQVLPANGVYASRSMLDGASYPSITNVGLRPTFGGTSVSVENHLLDYRGADFYGARVEVEFLYKIRDERRFSSADELKQQIAVDIAALRRGPHGVR